MMSRFPSFPTCSSSLRVSALFSADTFGLLRTAQPRWATANTPTLEAFQGSLLPAQPDCVLPTSTLLGRCRWVGALGSVPRAFGPHKAVLEYAGETDHVRRPRLTSAVMTSTGFTCPVVMAPVLSTTMMSTHLVDSSTLGSLDQHANLGAAAAADRESGLNGQAQGRRAGDDHDRTAAVNAAVALRLVRSRVARGESDNSITIGTKMPETRSASRWTCALSDWACSTSRAIWAAGCRLRRGATGQAWFHRGRAR